jgi:hypothetical protein
MKGLLAATTAWAILYSASVAAARTWTSLGGKYTTEAELLDIKDGRVKLQKADGSVVHVPLVALCPEDREFVKAQFPGVQEEQVRPGLDYREWTSRDGRFTMLAALIDYRGGTLHLRKVDGDEIFVALDKLSTDDRRWLREEMRQHQDAEGENGAGAEADDEVTEQIGPQTVDMKLVPLDPGTGRRRRRSNALAEYMLLMTQPQLFYMQLTNRENPHEVDFRRVVREEPDYAAPVPFVAVAELDSNEYAFALDAVGKKPDCYNQLYFDVNGNGDLTDDKPLDAVDVAGSAAARFVQARFPRVDLSIDGEGVETDHALLISVCWRRDASSEYASASLYAGAVREGQIGQGRKKIRLVLIDHNSNGRFDDRVSIRRRGSRLLVSEGDLLLVNPNPKNRLSADATMGRDRHFVSETICLGKNFYKLDIAPSGDRLTLEPTELAMGYVTNGSPAYRATVYSDSYGVLMISGVGGERIPLPEGEWKLASYAIDATGYTGGRRTAVTAELPNDPEPVRVDKDKTVALMFGAPFHPVVTASRRPDGKVSLSLSIVGVGGERCTSFYVNGRRPPEPRFEVRDADGSVVHQGKFEYG